MMVTMATGHHSASLFSAGRLLSPTGYINSNAALFTSGAFVAVALAVRKDLPVLLRGLARCDRVREPPACDARREPRLVVPAPSHAGRRDRGCARSPADRDRRNHSGDRSTRRRAADAARVRGRPSARTTRASRSYGRRSMRRGSGWPYARPYSSWRPCSPSWTSRARIPALSRTRQRALVRSPQASRSSRLWPWDWSPPMTIRSAYIKRQFKSTTQVPTTKISHFAVAGTERYDIWRVSFDALLAHPIGGLGQDNFVNYYYTHRHTSDEPRWTHSFELRLLAHTGLVGFILMAVALGGAVAAIDPQSPAKPARRGRRRGRRPTALHRLADPWLDRLVLGDARPDRAGARVPGNGRCARPRESPGDATDRWRASASRDGAFRVPCRSPPARSR